MRTPVGFAELGKLEQRFVFASLCSGTIEKLVGAKMPTMLDKHARIDPVAEFDQGLGCMDLVTADRRIHEIR